VRFGLPNREKPGIIGPDGKIRDLSKVVPDIAGDALSPRGDRIPGAMSPALGDDLATHL
jgi:hypothetical protein